MIGYPPSLPLSCAQDIIRIVKERKIAEEKQLFGLCVWNVQGYGMKVLLGEPEPLASRDFGDAGPACEMEDLENMASAIQEAHAQLASPEMRVGAATAAEGFDPTTLLQYLPMLIEILKQLGWLKKSPLG